jgi:hypothetical protein
MPWESGSGKGKYQYHPGGDTSAEPKDAPSALSSTVIPDVDLPKVCQFILSVNTRSGLGL